MRIGIVAKLKQGDILEALQKRGWNQSDGARFLGISPGKFGNLINMTDIPKTFSEALTNKLIELTGKFPEDLFPDFVRSRDFLDRPKVISKIAEATPQLLAGIGAIPKALPAPDEAHAHSLRREVLDAVLEHIQPAYREAVRRNIMEGETLQEIAEDLGVTDSEIGRRVRNGLRDLRHPKLARTLREVL